MNDRGFNSQGWKKVDYKSTARSRTVQTPENFQLFCKHIFKENINSDFVLMFVIARDVSS